MGTKYSHHWFEDRKTSILLSLQIFFSLLFIFPLFTLTSGAEFLTKHIKSMLDMTVITPITSFSSTLQTFPFYGASRIFFCCRRVFSPRFHLRFGRTITYIYDKVKGSERGRRKREKPQKSNEDVQQNVLWHQQRSI